jgi:hypothetical protein
MKHVRDMTPAEIQRMCARTYLAEAKRRQGQPMAEMLLQWAKNARIRAHSFKPEQGDLFGRSA